jgi:hypothetical protein
MKKMRKGIVGQIATSLLVSCCVMTILTGCGKRQDAGLRVQAKELSAEPQKQKSQQPQASHPQQAQTLPAGSQDPLLDEAVSVVMRKVESNCYRFNDSYFTVATSLMGLVGAKKRDEHIVQAKRIERSVKAYPISEGDQLNGSQWQGRITLHFNPKRRWEGDKPKWSDWNSVEPGFDGVSKDCILDLSKKNGEWQVEVMAPMYEYSAPDPKLIQQIAGK